MRETLVGCVYNTTESDDTQPLRKLDSLIGLEATQPPGHFGRHPLESPGYEDGLLIAGRVVVRRDDPLDVQRRKVGRLGEAVQLTVRGQETCATSLHAAVLLNRPELQREPIEALETQQHLWILRAISGAAEVPGEPGKGRMGEARRVPHQLVDDVRFGHPNKILKNKTNLFL